MNRLTPVKNKWNQDNYEMKRIIVDLRTGDEIPKCSKVVYIKASKRYFGDYWDGLKKATVRLNDRKYKKGDLLVIRETEYSKYTGRQIIAIASHVLKSFKGVQKGYVVISFDIVECQYKGEWEEKKQREKKTTKKKKR